LNDKDISAAHILFNFDRDFPIGESADPAMPQGHRHLFGNFSSQVWIGISGEEYKLFVEFLGFTHKATPITE
jgi:hypothetical protein